MSDRRPAAITSVLSVILCVLPLAAGPARVRVMTTVFPLQEFARAVAGEAGRVDLLLPPGAEIHGWQPRVSDIRKIAEDLDLFLYVGPVLEPWAADLAESVRRPGLRFLEAVSGLVLLPDGRGGSDPHIWLDFETDVLLLDRIAAALAEISPADGPGFRRRAEEYKSRLRALDARYAEALAPFEGKTLLVGGHAAFGYLARRYGLVQKAVFGASPDAAPSPREMMDIVTAARRDGVTTVFFEPGEGDRVARTVAAEIGARLRPLHPGHNLPRSRGPAPLTFLGLMEANLENLRDGLAGR